MASSLESTLRAVADPLALINILEKEK